MLAMRAYRFNQRDGEQQTNLENIMNTQRLINIIIATESHDRLNCDCAACTERDQMIYEYTAGLSLTTTHAASSYGISVLVDCNGVAYGVNDMTPVGEAMPLYHNIANRDGVRLQWVDHGHTLVGVHA